MTILITRVQNFDKYKWSFYSMYVSELLLAVLILTLSRFQFRLSIDSFCIFRLYFRTLGVSYKQWGIPSARFLLDTLIKLLLLLQSFEFRLLLDCTRSNCWWDQARPSELLSLCLSCPLAVRTIHQVTECLFNGPFFTKVSLFCFFSYTRASVARRYLRNSSQYWNHHTLY